VHHRGELAHVIDPNEAPAGHGRLGLWDTITIIVAIVIGTSIFTTPR